MGPAGQMCRNLLRLGRGELESESPADKIALCKQSFPREQTLWYFTFSLNFPDDSSGQMKDPELVDIQKISKHEANYNGIPGVNLSLLLLSFLSLK